MVEAVILEGYVGQCVQIEMDDMHGLRYSGVLSGVDTGKGIAYLTGYSHLELAKLSKRLTTIAHHAYEVLDLLGEDLAELVHLNGEQLKERISRKLEIPTWSVLAVQEVQSS